MGGTATGGGGARRGTLVLLALLGAWGGPAQGQDIYKWIDASGRVHYGDRPPPGSAARRLPACEGRDCGLGGYRDAPGRREDIRRFLWARDRLRDLRAQRDRADLEAYEEALARRREAAERRARELRERPPRIRSLGRSRRSTGRGGDVRQGAGARGPAAIRGGRSP